eukprot:509949-Pyramimonas_sp.AAC.1
MGSWSDDAASERSSELGDILIGGGLRSRGSNGHDHVMTRESGDKNKEIFEGRPRCPGLSGAAAGGEE